MTFNKCYCCKIIWIGKKSDLRYQFYLKNLTKPTEKSVISYPGNDTLIEFLS